MAKSAKPTLREKYEWLCNQLEITDPDLWEYDALLKLKQKYPNCESRSLYFCFSPKTFKGTIDEAVVEAMRSQKFSEEAEEQLKSK